MDGWGVQRGFGGGRGGLYFSKSNMMAVKYSCWRVRTPAPFFWFSAPLKRDSYNCTAKICINSASGSDLTENELQQKRLRRSHRDVVLLNADVKTLDLNVGS